MSITNERIAILTEFLNADEERAKELLLLEPDVAVKQINAQGFDFTELELRAYSEFITNQLADAELEGVAGGVSGNMDDFMSKDSIIPGSLFPIMVAYAIATSPWTIRR